LPSQFSIRAVLSYLSTRDQVKALVTGINTKGLAFFRAHIENSPDFSDLRESFPDPKFMVNWREKETEGLGKLDLTHCENIYINRIMHKVFQKPADAQILTQFIGRHLPFSKLHLKSLLVGQVSANVHHFDRFSKKSFDNYHSRYFFHLIVTE